MMDLREALERGGMYLESDIRNYSTDDGEEFWDMTPDMLIDALAEELAASPTCRLLVPDTGEIFQGGFYRMLHHMVAALRRGHGFRVEP